MEQEEFGGLIDNIRELSHWYPILPLLERLRTEKDTSQKLDNLMEVVGFVMQTLGSDLYRARAYLIARLSVETVKSDPRWRALVEEMFLPK